MPLKSESHQMIQNVTKKISLLSSFLLVHTVCIKAEFGLCFSRERQLWWHF